MNPRELDAELVRQVNAEFERECDRYGRPVAVVLERDRLITPAIWTKTIQLTCVSAMAYDMKNAKRAIEAIQSELAELKANRWAAFEDYELSMIANESLGNLADEAEAELERRRNQAT